MGQQNSRALDRRRFRAAIALGFLLSAAASGAERVAIAEWAKTGMAPWKERSFEGHTDYRVVSQEGQTYLAATSENAASALYREHEVDLGRTPYLNWRWRVQSLNGASNPLIKGEDDFPARVYVVVRVGFLPWQTLAINYVWAQAPMAQAFWHNPFTEKAVMVPVTVGEPASDAWRTERVNVREDFQRLFGKDIEAIDGVALMTDADNYGGRSAAHYGDIWFSSE